MFESIVFRHTTVGEWSPAPACIRENNEKFLLVVIASLDLSNHNMFLVLDWRLPPANAISRAILSSCRLAARWLTTNVSRAAKLYTRFAEIVSRIFCSILLFGAYNPPRRTAPEKLFGDVDNSDNAAASSQ
ncbi:hypothetical protein V9T40_008284 [Parthenolecanium corni]|uniref:Uncharacterized protein n=1 Tax=Parthenolecanium corni TaxID=536013 RepID=A0AAN9Y5T1_9HEMI